MFNLRTWIFITSLALMTSTIWAQSLEFVAFGDAQDAAEQNIDEAPLGLGKAFSEGTWTFQSYGSGSFASSDGNVYQGHIGLGYYFLDNHSINGQLVFGGVDGRDGAGDGALLGMDLLFRSHLFEGDKWTVYVDGGAGLAWTEHEFPYGGTTFNFTPQAGMGVTYDLGNGMHLMTGARWYHISNADRKGSENNPGYNSVMAYLGVMIPF